MRLEVRVERSVLLGGSKRNNFLIVELFFLGCGNILLLEIFE